MDTLLKPADAQPDACIGDMHCGGGRTDSKSPYDVGAQDAHTDGVTGGSVAAKSARQARKEAKRQYSESVKSKVAAGERISKASRTKQRATAVSAAVKEVRSESSTPEKKKSDEDMCRGATEGLVQYKPELGGAMSAMGVKYADKAGVESELEQLYGADEEGARLNRAALEVADSLQSWLLDWDVRLAKDQAGYSLVIKHKKHLPEREAQLRFALAGDGRGTWSEAPSREGSTKEEFMAYMFESRPMAGLKPVTVEVLQIMERMFEAGHITRKDLAVARARFDFEALMAEDLAELGVADKMWADWFRETEKELPKLRKGAIVAFHGKGEVMRMATEYGISERHVDALNEWGRGAVTFKAECGLAMVSNWCNREVKAKGLDRRGLALQLFDIMCAANASSQDRYAMARALNSLYPWGTGENQSHATVSVCSILYQMVNEKEWFAKKATEATGSEITASGLLGWIRELIGASVGFHTGPHFCALLLDSLGSAHTWKLWHRMLEAGFITVTTNHWPTLFKSHHSLVRRLRKHYDDTDGSLQEMDRVMCLTYKQELAAKYEWRLDVDKEKKTRSRPRSLLVAWDEQRQAFTAAKGLEKQLQEFSTMMGHAKSIKRESMQTAAQWWLQRAVWSTGGSTPGFKAYINAKCAVPKEAAWREIEELSDIAGHRWLAAIMDSLAKNDDKGERYEYHSKEALADAMNAEVVRLSKKGALEALSYQVVEQLLHEATPGLRAHSVRKAESGKCRLLLASELAHYVLSSMLMLGVSRVYDKDPRYVSTPSGSSSWLMTAWRSRVLSMVEALPELEGLIRCFDFEDFNSQHSSLSTALCYAGWGQELSEDQKTDPAFRDFEMICVWLALATGNASIRWFNGEESAMEATLASGVRITSETNTTLSATYEGPLLANLALAIKLLTGRDEHPRNAIYAAGKKGDDVIDVLGRMCSSSWLTGLLYDRVCRWTGLQGRQIKILHSRSYSEWERVMSGPGGQLMGSPTRVLATLIVSSPQNSAWRELMAGTAAMTDVSWLVVRRGYSAAFGKMFTRLTLPYWSTILVRTPMKEDSAQWAKGTGRLVAPRGKSEVFCLQARVPAEIYAAPLQLRGAGVPIVGECDKWACCRGNMGIEGGVARHTGLASSHWCCCEFCDITPHLPQAPGRPLRSRISKGVMRQLPSRMASDFVTWVLSTFPSTRRFGSSVFSKVRDDVHQDSYQTSLPSSEADRRKQRDAILDYSWSEACAAWVSICRELVEQHVRGSCDYVAAEAVRSKAVARAREHVSWLVRAGALDKHMLGSSGKFERVSQLVPGFSQLEKPFERCWVCSHKDRLRCTAEQLKPAIEAGGRVYRAYIEELFVRPYYVGSWDFSTLKQTMGMSPQTFGLAAYSAVKRQEIFMRLVEAFEQDLVTNGNTAASKSSSTLADAVLLLPAQIMSQARCRQFSIIARKLTRPAAMAWMSGSLNISVPHGERVSTLEASCLVDAARAAAEKILLNNTPFLSDLPVEGVEALIGVFLGIAVDVFSSDVRVRMARGA